MACFGTLSIITIIFESSLFNTRLWSNEEAYLGAKLYFKYLRVAFKCVLLSENLHS